MHPKHKAEQINLTEMGHAYWNSQRQFGSKTDAIVHERSTPISVIWRAWVTAMSAHQEQPPVATLQQLGRGCDNFAFRPARYT